MISFIDIIIIIILIWQGLVGYYRGFIFQATTLIALVVGVYGAYKFSDTISAFLANKYQLQEPYVPVAVFIAILIIIMLCIDFLGNMLNKAMDKFFLGFTNRLFGVVLAITKTVFLLSVVIFIFNYINSNASIISSDKINRSRLYTPISKVAPFVFPYIRNGFYSLQKEQDQQ